MSRNMSLSMIHETCYLLIFLSFNMTEPSGIHICSKMHPTQDCNFVANFVQSRINELITSDDILRNTYDSWKTQIFSHGVFKS